MKTVKIHIKSISPLLMNRRPLEEEEQVKIKGDNKENPVEAALKKAWVDDKIGFFVTTDMIEGVLREGGKQIKKGVGTFSKTVQSAVRVTPQETVLMDNGQQAVSAIPLGRKDYAVDRRYGTLKSTKGQIIVSRCRFDKWDLNFEVEYDESQIKEPTLRAIFEEAGKIGIGSYRYKFGRFKVDSFDVKE